VPLPSSWNEVLFLLALVWSLFVYAAAATCAAGLAGNLISALTRGGGIPDPFVLGGAAHGIAFNPADVFFLLGLSGLVAAALQSGTSSARSRQKRELEGYAGVGASDPLSSPTSG
jgi:lipoprotein signal peptidase